MHFRGSGPDAWRSVRRSFVAPDPFTRSFLKKSLTSQNDRNILRDSAFRCEFDLRGLELTLKTRDDRSMFERGDAAGSGIKPQRRRATPLERYRSANRT